MGAWSRWFTRIRQKVCIRGSIVHERHKRPKRGWYQRCEHPGFPGASSVCNVQGEGALNSPPPVVGSKAAIKGIGY
eukprot:422971-Pyramimonas_sp.AAC.5